MTVQPLDPPTPGHDPQGRIPGVHVKEAAAAAHSRSEIEARLSNGLSLDERPTYTLNDQPVRTYGPSARARRSQAEARQRTDAPTSLRLRSGVRFAFGSPRSPQNYRFPMATGI
eukprot:2807615-Pleurochrysis_carterae.AAC.1